MTGSNVLRVIVAIIWEPKIREINCSLWGRVPFPEIGFSAALWSAKGSSSWLWSVRTQVFPGADADALLVRVGNNAYVADTFLSTNGFFRLPILFVRRLACQPINRTSAPPLAGHPRNPAANPNTVFETYELNRHDRHIIRHNAVVLRESESTGCQR